MHVFEFDPMKYRRIKKISFFYHQHHLIKVEYKCVSVFSSKTKSSLRIYRLLSYSSQPKKKKKERKGILLTHGIEMNE